MRDSLPAIATTHALPPSAIYPLTSRPLTDLKVLIAFVPVLWLCGLEQILPPILLAWAAVKLLCASQRVRVPPVLIPLAALLIWQSVAPLTLHEPSDWLIVSRTAVYYASAFLVVLILANDLRCRSELHGLLDVVVALGFVTTVVGLLFALGVLPERFPAYLIGELLPPLLKSSSFVQEAILVREIGRADAVFGSLSYPRVSSLFLYSTGASVAYVMLLHWQLHRIETSRRVARWMLVAVFALSLLVFAFTGARVAWGAFLASLGLLVLLRWQLRWRLPHIALAVPLGLVTVVAIWAISSDASPVASLRSLFVDIRPASLRARQAIYEATFALWAQRPMVGWGVPRAATGLFAPAGTHGELLGVLFRNGLVGLGIYLSILACVWWQIASRLRQAVRSRDRALLRIAIVVTAVFAAMHIMAFTYNFYFDFTIVMLTWTTMGLLYSRALDAQPG